MMETIATTNGINIKIETEFEYVRFEPAYEYHDIDAGIVLIWRNPRVQDGISQVDHTVYPLTVAGIWQAYNDAKDLNTQIKKEVEDNTFTFR